MQENVNATLVQPIYLLYTYNFNIERSNKYKFSDDDKQIEMINYSEL